MTDVARLAGCSQSTVSVVLNDTPGIQISEATRRRVVEAANEVGYRLPVRADPLPSRHGSIVFVVDRLSTSPEAVVSVEGAREAAWPTGQVLLTVQTLNDPAMEERTLEMVLDHRPSGLIYATIMTRQATVPAILHGANVPVVLLNCTSRDHAFPAVVPGEVAGGHRATEHLIRAGHRRIATILGDGWMDATQDWLKGYRRALATADIPFDPALVREGNWQFSAGYAETHLLLDMPDPPTAIFCQNDRMAVGCYEAVKERGLRIPDDISVIGYDDEEVARHLSPLLTTLVLPHREMGRWAVEAILSDDGTGRDRYPVTKLECPLVERGSVARLDQ
jgi:LacI family transcriptional regulator